MTIKAYRSTRYNADRMPKQPQRTPTRRTGSFWGVTWQIEDLGGGELGRHARPPPREASLTCY
jgi:hypothetical protein